MGLDEELNDALAPFAGREIDAQTTTDVYKVLIPVLRKHLPTIVAQDILGVELMSSLFEPYKVLSEDNWDFHVTVDVNDEVAEWIWQQPVSEWAAASSFAWPYARYYITQELLTLIALKWS